MEDCTFCKIIAGDLPGSFVYRDELCSAFMDRQPINDGHLLVIPNQHYSGLSDLPLDLGPHLFLIAQKLALAIRQSSVQCEGINVFLADGEAAFQDIFHVHLHVIPRLSGDGFKFHFSPSYSELPPREDLNKNAFHIKNALDEILTQE